MQTSGCLNENAFCTMPRYQKLRSHDFTFAFSNLSELYSFIVRSDEFQ